MQPSIEPENEANAATLEAMLVQQAELLGRFFTDAIAKSMASADSKEAACYGNMALKAHNFCRQLLPAIRRETESPRALKAKAASDEEAKTAQVVEQKKFLDTVRDAARKAVNDEIYFLGPQISRLLSSPYNPHAAAPAEPHPPPVA